MDALVGTRSGGDVKYEHRDTENNCNSDPVVYQLVRVEGDGTLVPATEDEVMEFEHLLDDEKNSLPSFLELGSVDDVIPMRSLDISTSHSCGASKIDFSILEPQRLDRDLKEDLHCTESQDIFDQIEKAQANNMTAKSITDSTAVTCLSNQTEDMNGCSSSVNEAANFRNGTYADSRSDVSFPKGEILMDNLTMRQLQELFRTIFGRETTVKDKLWLKRRIAMGLTNSCNIHPSEVMIKDNRVVLKENKGETFCAPGSFVFKSNSAVLDQNSEDKSKHSPTSYCSESGYQRKVCHRIREPLLELDLPKEKIKMGESSGKRMRKPTKRYIEELSDCEAGEPFARIPSSKSLIKPADLGSSWSKNFPTRQDSLGGTKVHVPYTSRSRRSRPRKEFVAFLSHDEHSSDECTMAKSMCGASFREENESNSDHTNTEVCESTRDVREVESDHARNQQLVNKGNEQKGTRMTNMKQEVHLEAVKLPEGKITKKVILNSRSAKKGRLIRKHHRAWTLCEVMKLVEGVAKYGAGRWSEIRRLAFSSYSYRTSVDLKDKWRNLLKASLAQPTIQKDGMCARKNSPAPIPVSILSRVRELAEMQVRNCKENPVRKFPESSAKALQEKGSGFL